MAGSGIPNAFLGRRGQMQHLFRQTGETQKAGEIIQIAPYRANAKLTPEFPFRRTAQQGEHPKASRKPGSGASGHIPAADN
jgi:hypothetical protein